MAKTEQTQPDLNRSWLHIPRVPGVDGVDGLSLEFENRAGRMVVVGLYVHGAEITPGMLREIPLARLSAIALTPDEPGMPFRWTREHADPTVSDLRSATAALRGAKSTARKTAPLSAGKLGLLRAAGLNDEFFAELARVYRQAVAETRAPAKLIADELGIPVGTVHRWVREARIAGALPPARKGAAG